MIATLYLWGTYTSDSVRKVQIPIPQKPGGAQYDRKLAILLIDDIVQYDDNNGDIDSVARDEPDLEEIDGTLILRVGRLSSNLYWNQDDPAKAETLAEKELAEYLSEFREPVGDDEATYDTY
jgi:hypothetical protein